MGNKLKKQIVTETDAEPVKETVIAESPVAVTKMDELGMEINYLMKLVEDFRGMRPKTEVVLGAEDLAMKRYNEKVAQISGVLLAAAVSVKEVIGK